MYLVVYLDKHRLRNDQWLIGYFDEASTRMVIGVIAVQRRIERTCIED